MCRVRCLRGAVVLQFRGRVFLRVLRSLFFSWAVRSLVYWCSTPVCWPQCCKITCLMSFRLVMLVLPLTGHQQCMFLSASSLCWVLVRLLWVLALWSFDSFTCLHVYFCILVLSGAAHVSGFTEFGAVRPFCGSILRGPFFHPLKGGVFFGGIRAWASDSAFVFSGVLG